MKNNLIAEKKKCYLCSGEAFRKREGAVRDNASLDILECINCGLVFLSSSSHIYDGFYHDSKMHESDTTIEEWLQETFFDDERRFKAFKEFLKNKSVLDFGCGAGGFLKRVKKITNRIQGVEPESRLETYFKKEKIPVVEKIEEVKQTFNVITLFHVLEHLPDPVFLLKQLGEKLEKKGSIIVEVPNANDALISLYESEAFSKFTYWSCHLFLFTNSTLVRVAEKSGLKINYIKQIQRYPLSNHLYWLSKGKPGGHKIWNFFDCEELNKIYERKLESIGACDTILASFSNRR